MSRPAELARKCFAVAKSTSHEGERAAAINRGMALLERAGLNPDHFDIPGRAKAEPRRIRIEFPPGMRPTMAEMRGLDNFIMAMDGQPLPGGFSMDDMVREAVAETIRRRMRRQNGVD